MKCPYRTTFSLMILNTKLPLKEDIMEEILYFYPIIKIKKMKNTVIGFIALLFIMSSCGSSIKVSSQYDHEVDFKEYKTYSYLGWSNNSDDLMNDFDKRRVEAAFAYEFESRGMKQVATGGDVEISLFLVTEQKTATTAYTNHYGVGGPAGYGYGGYGGYYYGSSWGWGGGYSTTTYQEYDYTNGTLVCDVFDGKEKKLVWQSVGSGTVDDDASSRDKGIPKAVAKIMSLYPVQPISK